MVNMAKQQIRLYKAQMGNYQDRMTKIGKLESSNDPKKMAYILSSIK